MTTRVITPPSMDINRDIGSQSCPDGQPSVVDIPGVGGDTGDPAGLPESAGVPITTHHSLGCPSPALSPNSSVMGPSTELILSTRIRSVPRCLFGPPDPHTAQFARERVREIREQDRKRYNFDFDQEQPLEGPFKWEPVQLAAPSTTKGNTGRGGYAPKAYALSRFPYLSGNMVQVDRGNTSPPPVRTTINNNQLPPTRQLYFQPDLEEEREPLLIARPLVSPTSTYTTTARPVTSIIKLPSSTVISYPQSSSDSSAPRVPPVDPTLVLPSPEASSCSSEDSANVADMDMDLEDEEEIPTSVESSSTEDDSNVLRQSSKSQSTSTSSSSPATILHHSLSSSTSSGLSSRLTASLSRSSSSSRRTKSVSSSSSSPSASPSSPTSSQPPITRFLPLRKRPASTSTTKAASESGPASAAASTENKRTAM